MNNNIDPKKILVIRPDAIGDMVMTIPAVLALKKKFTKSKITVLIRKYTYPLLQNISDIDEIIFDEIYGKKFNLSQYFNFANKIKEKKFDLVVHFYNELPYILLGSLAKIPYRLGDSSRLLFGWINNLRVFRKWNDFTRHDVLFNIDLLEPLGIKENKPDLKLAASAESLKNIEGLLAEINIQPSDLLTGIHIGAGRSNNQPWSAAGLAQLIDWLIQKKNAKVVLTGGKEEIGRAEEIQSLAKSKSLNFTGKLSLEELLALTSKYKFYVGMDTGPTHIAAAFKIPMVVINASKRAKPLRWGPWGTRHLIVRKPVNCSKVCIPPQCKVPICPQEILPNEVIQACEEVLSGGGAQNEEKALDHWRKKSFSVALINNSHSSKTAARAQELLSLLKAEGYNAYLVSGRNPISLLGTFIKHDTNIIHQIDRKGSFSVSLAWQLTGSFLSNRALLVKDKNEPFDNSRQLIDYYTNKFRNTLL